jgi:hypothetical protein
MDLWSDVGPSPGFHWQDRPRESALTAPAALMLLYNNVAELRQIRGAKATG